MASGSVAAGASVDGGTAPLPASGDFESRIRRWRARALDQLLWAAVGISAVPLLILFFVKPRTVSSEMYLPSLLMYILLVAVAAARRAPHLVRGWGLLLVGYGFAAMTFAATGLGGGGRLLLVALPLHAVILLGPRSGYLALAVSLTLYTAAAVLRSLGLLDPIASARGETSEWEFWLLQGALLFVVLAPIFLLVSRFIGLLRRAAAAEQEASQRIAEADREGRRLQLMILETGERERRSVGHQLHDGPCQQITAALLRCKVAQKALAARGADEEVGHVAAISEMLDTSVGEIHDLARGLSPPEISPGALVSALSDLVQRVRATGSVTCEFSHDGIVPPKSVGTSSQLYRIAQEAISNAVRHSGAGHIGVELTGKGGVLRLSVRDDGAGIAPGTGRGGMGLRIMRHRAELMGGTLSIGAAEGGGTAVVCTLPLSALHGIRGSGP